MTGTKTPDPVEYRPERLAPPGPEIPCRQRLDLVRRRGFAPCFTESTEQEFSASTPCVMASPGYPTDSPFTLSEEGDVL
jgi:hypothetical protein